MLIPQENLRGLERCPELTGHLIGGCLLHPYPESGPPRTQYRGLSVLVVIMSQLIDRPTMLGAIGLEHVDGSDGHCRCRNSQLTQFGFLDVLVGEALGLQLGAELR